MFTINLALEFAGFIVGLLLLWSLIEFLIRVYKRIVYKTPMGSEDYSKRGMPGRPSILLVLLMLLVFWGIRNQRAENIELDNQLKLIKADIGAMKAQSRIDSIADRQRRVRMDVLNKADSLKNL